MREIQSLKTQYRVSDFITWQRDRLLVLNPNFQRRSVWKKGAKSYLIDTILKGLPIPIIFLRDLRADLKTFKSKRDVVDGQQRIRTILTYISPELLDDYDAAKDGFVISRSHNLVYAGRSFAELPDDARQRILDYQFSVHSFSAETDDKEVLQIFARMNSTGYRLNAQELRNAEWFGEFKQASYDLALEQLNRWMDWTIFNGDQISRMREVEFTSELIVLMMQGLAGQSGPRLDKYYEDYDDEFHSYQEIKSRFHDMMDTIENLFVKSDIRQLLSSKTLFYALFSVIYDLRYGLLDGSEVGSPLTAYQSQITKVKPNVVDRSSIAYLLTAAQAIYDRKAPQDVVRAMRGATSDIGSRRLIVDFLAGRVAQ